VKLNGRRLLVKKKCQVFLIVTTLKSKLSKEKFIKKKKLKTRLKKQQKLLKLKREQQ
jgi:hypothetical protein